MATSNDGDSTMVVADDGLGDESNGDVTAVHMDEDLEMDGEAPQTLQTPPLPAETSLYIPANVEENAVWSEDEDDEDGDGDDVDGDDKINKGKGTASTASDPEELVDLSEIAEAISGINKPITIHDITSEEESTSILLSTGDMVKEWLRLLYEPFLKENEYELVSPLRPHVCTLRVRIDSTFDSLDRRRRQETILLQPSEVPGIRSGPESLGPLSVPTFQPTQVRTSTSL